MHCCATLTKLGCIEEFWSAVWLRKCMVHEIRVSGYFRVSVGFSGAEKGSNLRI
jgi:hypothetical protein